MVYSVPSKFHVREESIWILVEPLPYCFSPASSILFPSCFSFFSFHAHYFMFEADTCLKIWSVRAAACNGGLLVDRCAVFLEVSPDSVVRNRACRAVHWVCASSCSRVHDNSEQTVQLRGIMRRRACFWIRRRTCNFHQSILWIRNHVWKWETHIIMNIETTECNHQLYYKSIARKGTELWSIAAGKIKTLRWKLEIVFSCWSSFDCSFRKGEERSQQDLNMDKLPNIFVTSAPILGAGGRFWARVSRRPRPRRQTWWETKRSRWRATDFLGWLIMQSERISRVWNVHKGRSRRVVNDSL